MTPVNSDKGVPQTIRDIENNGDEVIIVSMARTTTGGAQAILYFPL